MDLNVLALLLVCFSAGMAVARWSLARCPVPKIQKWVLGTGVAVIIVSCCYGSSGRDLQFALPPLHPAWAFIGATIVALGMILLVFADLVREHKIKRAEKAVQLVTHQN